MRNSVSTPLFSHTGGTRWLFSFIVREFSGLRAVAPARPKPDEVTIYIDGACSGNPGPGGWAAIIVDGGSERHEAGGEPHTTSQRMELTAAIGGLSAIPDRRRVHVHSDSAYVVNCFRDCWWERWKRNGWRNGQGQPVANRDLWERLLAEADRHDVTWHHVPGHIGNPMNTKADSLARAAVSPRLVEKRKSYAGD